MGIFEASAWLGPINKIACKDSALVLYVQWRCKIRLQYCYFMLLVAFCYVCFVMTIYGVAEQPCFICNSDMFATGVVRCHCIMYYACHVLYYQLQATGKTRTQKRCAITNLRRDMEHHLIQSAPQDINVRF